MLHAGKGGEPFLDEVDFRPEDELAMRQHRVDLRLDVGFQPFALALQVEKRNPPSLGDAEGRARTLDGHRREAPFREGLP